MLPSTVPIYVATSPIDMRRSFDALADVMSRDLEIDPKSGALAVFYNRSRDRMKIFWFDRTGFCVLYKHLEDRLFRIPEPVSGQRSIALDARELIAILEGVPLPRQRKTARMIAREARSFVLPTTKSNGTYASP